VAEPDLFSAVDPEVLTLARQMALESQEWGRIPYKAIEAGHWDNGHVVRQFVAEAERQIIRNRPEATGD